MFLRRNRKSDGQRAKVSFAPLNVLTDAHVDGTDPLTPAPLPQGGEGRVVESLCSLGQRGEGRIIENLSWLGQKGEGKAKLASLALLIAALLLSLILPAPLQAGKKKADVAAPTTLGPNQRSFDVTKIVWPSPPDIPARCLQDDLARVRRLTGRGCKATKSRSNRGWIAWPVNSLTGK